MHMILLVIVPLFFSSTGADSAASSTKSSALTLCHTPSPVAVGVADGHSHGSPTTLSTTSDVQSPASCCANATDTALTTENEAAADLEYALLGDPTSEGAQHISFVAAGSRGLIYRAGRNSETTAVKYSFAVESICQTSTGPVQSRATCWVNTDALIVFLRTIDLSKLALDARVPFPSLGDFFNRNHWPAGEGTTLQSPRNVESEWRTNVEAAASPMTMGVNVAIDRRLVPLPLSRELTCACCDRVDNCEVTSINLVVERQMLFPYSAQTLSDAGNLRDDDFFVLYCNWMSDQLTFWSNFNRMHVDGQLKNILVSNRTGTLVYVWNDFGRSTTDKDSTTGDTTISQIQRLAAVKIANFPTDYCVSLDVACVTQSLNAVCVLPPLQNSTVPKRSVARLLITRISILEAAVHSQTAQIVDLQNSSATQMSHIQNLQADNATQSKQIATQSTQIAIQSAQILDLQDDKATQSAQIATQSTQIAMQSAQIATQSAQILDLQAVNATQSIQIATQSAQILDLQADNATQSTQIATQSAQILVLQADNATQSMQIATQSAQILVLQADNATQSTQIATQSAQIAAQSTQIAAQSTQIATQSTQIATQSAQIATQSAQILDLQADNATQSAQIVSQSTQLATLSSQVDELSKKFDELILASHTNKSVGVENSDTEL